MLTFKQFIPGSDNAIYNPVTYREVIEGTVDFWTLAQFQANAGIILPKGYRVYYKNSLGIVTGTYKIGNGINTVSTLPIFVDNMKLTNDTIWNNTNNIGSGLLGGYTHTGLNRKVYATDLQLSNPGNFIKNYLYRGRFFNVNEPMYVTHCGIHVLSYTSGIGKLNFALYRFDPGFTATLLGTGTLINTITTTGLHIVTLNTPVLVEPGNLYIAVAYFFSGNYGMATGSNLRYALIRNNGSNLPAIVTGVSWTGGANAFPTTLPNTCFTTLARAYHICYYLFTQDNLI